MKPIVHDDGQYSVQHRSTQLRASFVKGPPKTGGPSQGGR